MRRFLLSLVTALALLSPVYAQVDPAVAAAPAMPANRFAERDDWWKRAVFYELYPRSFADSDNDGTGDINGIISRLDHLKALGIDAVWITPCFPSPQVDFGYDVSDYNNIDPQYGTLADFDRLVAEGKKRGIKIILDLVVNHTSDQHEWFKQAKSFTGNSFRDFYVWRSGKGNQPPNNWISIFGGSAWELDPTTKQWYYHAFYPQQPDLNWRNPAVEKAVFDVTRFWYKRGVYGFRLDAVDTMFEDAKLRDNPVRDEINAYGEKAQNRLYNAALPEVHTALQRLRKVADEFPGRVLIGETWTDTPEALAEYYGPNLNELQMPMYFNFMIVDKLSPETFRQRIAAIEQNKAGGWPVYVLNNHDRPRSINRYGDGKNDDQIAKLMAAFYLTLRGTPILYYGEEIGMTNHDPQRIEDVKDVIGRKGWPKEKGRDGERTPMQWSAEVNAGFNKGGSTWLPINPNYTTRNVATQNADPKSMLNWYRALIRLRRENPAIYEGSYTVLNETDPNVVSYARRTSGRTVIVALNMSARPQAVSFTGAKLGAKSARVVLGTRASGTVTLDSVELEPFGVVIAEIR